MNEPSRNRRPTAPPPRDRRREIRRLLASALLMGLMGFIALVYTHPWTAPPKTRVAVARFDNQTAKPEYDSFAGDLTGAVRDALSDASSGHYRVVGNAAILRVPQEHRSLPAIASTLGVKYVVVGKIERSPLGIRVAADLIRLPDQTHLRVVSFERKADDLKRTRQDLARTIADQFAPRLSLLTSIPQ